MSSVHQPSDPDERAADDLILGGDFSQRAWRRRAVRMPREQALSEIPRAASMQALAPIEPARAIKAHIAQRDSSDARWIRQAIADRYLREGGDVAVAQAFLVMKEDHRRRDVPRDPYGQDRNRVGRKGPKRKNRYSGG